jgi:peptidoglycan hydrolase-like protein with peptidoglycan-binding domain
MTGEWVKQAQWRLCVHGQGVAVDGIFGQQTLDGTRHFQAAAGLVVDGVIGVHTWTALLA